MMKIKVYNIDEFVKSHYPGYAAFRYEKAAIFEGKNGVVFAEHEAVHKKENLLTDSVVIPLCKRPSAGHIAILATAELTVSLDEIVAGAPFEEMTIEKFFDRRDYNPRCQNNYATLMKSLRDIGFDLHGYFEDKTPIEEQIKGAKALGLKTESDMRMMPMPGTDAPDWGKRHWGSEGNSDR